MADFSIATEDRLSESVAERIIAATGHRIAHRIPKDRRRHPGFGYLKTRLPDFVKACHGGLNFFILTDLDTRSCPPDLLHEWFGTMPQPDNLLLRVAVREIEAWILADRVRFARWLGVPKDEVPMNPEMSRDPKSALLRLAKKSHQRDLRLGLLPKKGAPSPVGLEYNDLLGAFVSKEWCAEEAALLAPSLTRTLKRLRAFQNS